MKFGRRLNDDLMEPHWESHYLRYRQLKKLIKVLSLMDKSCNTGEGTLVAQLLSTFPRKKKIFHKIRERNNDLTCTPCKRWNVFLSVVSEDLEHVVSFIETTLQHLERLYASDVGPGIQTLLSDKKNKSSSENQDGSCRSKMGVDDSRGEPRLLPGSPELEKLTKLAHFHALLTATRRFLIVNSEALRKITKKFIKRVLVSVDIQTDGCGPACARHLARRAAGDSSCGIGLSLTEDDEDDDIFSPTEEEERYASVGNPQQIHDLGTEGFHAVMDNLATRPLEQTCKDALNRLNALDAKVKVLETEVMVECSPFYEFLIDQKSMLKNLRQYQIEDRVQRRKHTLTQITQHIDINQVQTHFFVIVAVILPMLTLAITYYLSLGIYVDEENKVSILHEKGWFISASIDRAPASNIGTLGLNTTLMLLSVIVYVKHKLVKKQLRGRTWMRTHRVSTLFGFLSIFCGGGVAAFQHEDHATAHNSFAATFFIFGMVHVVMETFVDYYHSLSLPRTRVIRVTVASLLILCVTGFLVPMAYVISSKNSDNPAPAQVLRLYRLIAATFEVAAFACFVIWFASYYHILRSSQIQFNVIQRSRLPSTEDLSKLKTSAHHRRNTSCDSLDSQDLDWTNSDNLVSMGLADTVPASSFGTFEEPKKFR